MRNILFTLLAVVAISCTSNTEKKSTKETQIEVDESKTTGELVNKQKQGKWTTFYTNGQVQSISFWKDNKPNGMATRFWPNGKPMQELYFVNGIQDSLMKSWYTNGNLEEESFWKNDTSNGPAKTYFENGKLESEGEWKMGKQHGKWNSYDSLGNLIQTQIYIDGVKKE